MPYRLGLYDDVGAAREACLLDPVFCPVEYYYDTVTNGSLR